MKPALLIIDMQKAFFGGDCEKSMKDASEYINKAIGQFREKKLPIIVVQHKNEKNNLVPKENGFEVIDLINLKPEDIRIHKTYSNAFNKTELDQTLKSLKADTIIATGFCAEGCVLSTCRGALDYDYTAIVLINSLASPSEENIRAVERITDSISYGALQKFTENL